MPALSGPSPGDSSGGPKTRRGGHILKMLYWMYAAASGPNVKWGGTYFKWGGWTPLAPPLATSLDAVPLGELGGCIRR